MNINKGDMRYTNPNQPMTTPDFVKHAKKLFTK